VTEPGARGSTDHRTERAPEDGTEATPDGCSHDRSAGFGIFVIGWHAASVLTRSLWRSMNGVNKSGA
jgi:hypothetical protein